MAEQSTVNRQVVGSSPTRPANKNDIMAVWQHTV
jgi:hypothetical protein